MRGVSNSWLDREVEVHGHDILDRNWIHYHLGAITKRKWNGRG